MKSIIICEGPTDFTLLQYYMRKVNNWNEGQKSTFNPKGFENARKRDFVKDGNLLTIICANGCSRMSLLLSKVIELNSLATPLVIPFDENGAIETFLLQTLKKENEYDASVIERGNKFVDEVASEKKYLKHRRDITKSKLDVFFSVRTPAEQFTQRQNILKNIPWEEYENIRECFKELKKL